MNAENGKEWWRGAVIYQIYPRSYMDSNNDGVGDLLGIMHKLDYIANLGVDAIWISPFTKSPMKDFGYDVSDYYDVDPLFGTLDDFKALINKAHDLNLRVIMDLVLSHTSDQHQWFKESASSKSNDKSDWYVWAPPNDDGSPPNNWQSLFGGPAWTFHTKREQYYLHNFLKEQPDLNFHNAEVRKATLDIAKFWLDFGVDGFRLDVVNFYFHDLQLRNNPPRDQSVTSVATQLEFLDPYGMQMHIYDKSQPENLSYLKELRRLTDQYDQIMLVGEIGDDRPIERTAEYTSGDELLHTAYNLNLMSGTDRNLTPDYIQSAIETYLEQPGDSWPSWAFSNHDVVRVLSRWGSQYDYHCDFAKMVNVLLCCLRGTIYLYQGEELGLKDAVIPYDRIQDPWGKVLWPEWQGRDGCRTPMPWTNELHLAGFSNSEPWLPIVEEHSENSVEKQSNDPHSVLNFTKSFLTWRKNHPSLKLGKIEFPELSNENILGFKRILNDEIMLCLFNLSNQDIELDLNLSNDNSRFEAQNLSAMINVDTVTLPAFGIYVGYASSVFK
jgi:alpha-glucosidase